MSMYSQKQELAAQKYAINGKKERGYARYT